MEKEPGTFGSVMENGREYFKTKVELIKLQAIDKSSEVTSSVVYGIALFFVAIFAFIFLNIGIALWIGNLLDRTYLGFFILTAIYIIIGVLLHVFHKKWITDPITTMLIKKMLN